MIVKITPLGIDTPKCDCCGEWIGASEALLNSISRHNVCFNALVIIQEEFLKENPDMKVILGETIKAIGDRRESTETS